MEDEVAYSAAVSAEQARVVFTRPVHNKVSYRVAAAVEAAVEGGV
jgi:hypothetical protein